MTANGHGVSFGNHEAVLKLTGDGFKGLKIY